MASSVDLIQAQGVLTQSVNTTVRQRPSTWRELGISQRNHVRERETTVGRAEVVDIRSEQRIDCLVGSPVFHGLSREQCRGIGNACDEMLYSSEQIIFLQDEPVRRVMLVATGAVRMSRVTEAGKETLLRLERPGGWLDDTVGSDQRHSACARAKQACMLLAWEIEQFEHFSSRIPAIERNMAGIISSRLQGLQDRLCDLSTRPAPQRLARLVMQLANLPESTCAKFIALSREEMAQMTGTSLFTVSRLLSSWADSEIVTLDRSTIRIEDMDRLQELAEAA